MNRRNENAIVVYASSDNSWKPIGYIPGLKVAKDTQAIRRMEIANISINSIKEYIFPIASFKYFARVTITKKGRWMKYREIPINITKIFDFINLWF